MLVVGASSGLGRALAEQAGSAGATVALAARRLELVEELAASIRVGGGEARAWHCDVTDPEACAALVDEAAAWMGGIDMVLYMSGTGAADQGHRGAAGAVAGAVRHQRGRCRPRDRPRHRPLAGGQAPVVVVTTHSMGIPWPWLGVYGSTKAALAELARALRAEEPGLRVVCVAVGNTVTSFADNWDPELYGRALELWLAEGMLRYEVLQADDMAARMLVAALEPDGPDDLLIAGADTSAAGS